jgi:hypothetical protein
MAFFSLYIYTLVLLVRPQEWWAPIRGWELINVAAIVTIAATFITHGRGNEPFTKVLQDEPHAKWMWALFGAVLLSEMTKIHLSGTLAAFQSFGKLVVFFFLTVIVIDNPARLRKMMWLLIISALLMCFHAYLQVRTGVGFGNILPLGSLEAGDLRVRGSGMFGDPNDFATLYIMAAPFAIGLVRARSNLFTKLIFTAALVPVLYVLYHTQSTGGALGFGMMLIALFWAGRRFSVFRTVVIVSIVASLFFFAPARVRGRVGGGEDRVMLWGIGNQLLKRHPLFGVGYDKFLYHNRTAAHSAFVNCYAELGMVGYTCWVGLFWAALRSLRRVSLLKTVLPREIVILAQALMAALVGYLTAGVFLTRTYHYPLYFLVALSVGLLRYVRRLPNVPKDLLTITAADVRRTALIALASIPALWLFIRVYNMRGGGG